MGFIDEIRFRSLPKEERIERIAGALVNGGRKRMASIEMEKLDHGLVQAHRRRVLADEQHAASLVRTPVEIEPPFELNDEDFECECGGTYDEYDRCSDCVNGHDDCEPNECESCLERSIDRAEMYADMARDEEMGV